MRMNKLSIALGVSIFSLSTNVYAADLLAPPPPYKPLPDFHSTPGIPNLPWNTPRRLPEQFELPDSSPPGILQSGHGIADGIVMPDDISSTKLDSEEIYKKNAPSIMRIMTSWPSPVTEKDLPLISDEKPEDGSLSLREKASKSIKEGHPMTMTRGSNGSGVAIFKAKATKGVIMYYLTNCHVLHIDVPVEPQVIFNNNLVQYSNAHTIKILNQFENDMNELLTNTNPSAEVAQLVEARPDIDICVISVHDDSSNKLFHNGNPVIGIRPFNDLKVGENVYAIGNPAPGETLTWSLTNGIISALRDGQKIQTSAAITHGNSGGGLFDERGNLIGIVSSGYMETTQGFNFAIAADKIWRIYGR